MSEQKFFNSDEEKTFGKAMIDVLPEIPPAEILKKVIPCRRAMNFIIAGLALSTIHINIFSFSLEYIMSAVGFMFLLLGFRTLKNENNWFKLSWVVSIIESALYIFTLGVNATIYRTDFFNSSFGKFFQVINVLMLLFLLIFFAQGLKILQEKAGLKARIGCVIAMIFWYLAIFVLGVMKADVLIIGFFVLLVIYILLIRSLCKIAKALYASGYAIKAKPLRLSDKWLVTAFTAVAVVVISCGFIFFRSFPMDWTPVPENEHSSVEDIKSHLLELGFPENVLNDLSEEDIKACEGAVKVVAETKEFPINKGREVTERYDYGTSVEIKTHTVYDVKEMVTSNVLVLLPGDKIHWKVFHHFYWKVDPGFFGTEALQMWYPGKNGKGQNAFSLTSEFTGRVMYDDGKTYAASYYALNEKDTATFFGMSSDSYLDFSMPRSGKNKRCYVSYEFKQYNTDYVISPWVNYYHQMSLLQYPVYIASDYCAAGKNGNVFEEVQSAMSLTYEDVMSSQTPSGN